VTSGHDKTKQNENTKNTSNKRLDRKSFFGDMTFDSVLSEKINT